MIRIANGQGFWGDSVDAPVRLVREGPVDVLTLDYLAEVTMSIMQKLKRRDPEGRSGYATDFVNESAQRKVFIDMVDRIALKNVPTKDAVAQAAAEEQKLLDAFYSK